MPEANIVKYIFGTSPSRLSLSYSLDYHGVFTRKATDPVQTATPPDGNMLRQQHVQTAADIEPVGDTIDSGPNEALLCEIAGR